MRSMHFIPGNYEFLTSFFSLARERPDSILGVFIRYADDVTLEPLNDPTGWQAMGDAGTRPSERPLVPRSESNMTTQSTSSTASFCKYNYDSTNSTAKADTGQPSLVSQYSLKNTVAAVGNPEQFRGEIFGNGPLRVEPEPLQFFADNQSKTPTPVSSARMSSSAATNSPPTPSQSWPHPFANSTKFTDQQPKPTPPPSIATSFCSRPTNSSSSNSKQASVSDAEKRQTQLQSRVYRARTQMPGHIPLRVFREPAECVEAQEILDRNT